MVVDLLVYGGVLLAEMVVRSLPLPAAMAVADAAGTLWHALDGRRRRRARENIAVAERGGLPVGDARALVRASLRSLIRVPVELFVFPRYFGRAHEVRRRVRFYGDWPQLRRDILSGRGGLIVGGHVGNWELPAWSLRFLPVRARAVVRPIENPYIDRRASRDRGGALGVIRKRGAVREILRTLRADDWVVLMGDQNAGRSGIFVPFFGLVASTYATPAVLAARAGVPVYMGACLRRRDGPLRFDFHVRRLPDPPAGADPAEAGRRLTAATMQVLETWVRMAPEQYNWVHRRWKSRPVGEAAAPHLPGYAEPPPAP
ncbi:MAG: lysophospholipid acyltransferase family protein [Planctomycetota bacterium]|jgi:KDO2-lipid IV(A) lauroyltransferase